MMKCPICGEELKLSKKNPGYALCHNCRKKFRLPKKATKKAPEADKPLTSGSAGSSAAPLDDELTDRTQIFSREEVRAALRKANSERKAEKAAQRATAKSASRKASAASRSSAEGSGTPADEDDGEYHFRYANIPPKEVREKQEREMRKAYDELLSIGEEERSSKRKGLFGRKK